MQLGLLEAFLCMDVKSKYPCQSMVVKYFKRHWGFRIS